MTMRTFYRTVYTVEVLSEDPIPDGVDFSHIWAECEGGANSGSASVTISETVDGPTMAALLMAQGSDPAFFGLHLNGDDDHSDNHSC